MAPGGTQQHLQAPPKRGTGGNLEETIPFWGEAPVPYVETELTEVPNTVRRGQVVNCWADAHVR
jgi:hypothetical protein